jgi:hypothetical protein
MTIKTTGNSRDTEWRKNTKAGIGMQITGVQRSCALKEKIEVVIYRV